eukprot:CAMPEP_0198261298 /NCGR_PEP_ID=MMETSP1447-20131203/10035_1 /TAXON_ID=420782 /ORGANISM="Chaetoceros dichaeta, Strain CCMP1751" /LENGTH=367 /DNA_ID=CAMNT_0043949159 /DNA_START=71 /DNA_END=1174 /DNA_ORIENTATION=+
MVVTHRSPSDSYLQTLQSDVKYQTNRSASNPSVSSPSSILPSFSSGPGLTDDAKARRSAALVPNVIKICFFATAFYCIYTLRSKLSIRDNELSTIRRDFDYIEEALVLTEAEVNRAQNSLVSLQTKFGNLLPGGQEVGATKGEEFNKEGTLFQKIESRQNAMKRRVNELQNTIAGMHRREAVEHFGTGKYQLEFKLRIDSESFSFTVEMASIDSMPHSVNYFMEQINAKVWDNTVITYGADHILFAQLRDAEGNDKRHLLSEINISSLAFPEYSDKYPHRKYTLGFSGRPGGPAFYINTEDNSVIHGPGGQAHHALHEEADPCFGVVVDGFNVIDWMIARKKNVASELNEGRSINEVHTVIESVRII